MLNSIKNLRTAILDLRKKDGNAAPENSDGRFALKKISGQIRPENQPIDQRLIAGTGLGLFLIAAGFIFWQTDYLTATLFALLGAVMIMVGFKKKQIISWELRPSGLHLGPFLYPYANLKSFWVEYDPPRIKELSFRSKKWYHSYIKIPLNSENPLEIRNFLLLYLSEERHEDTLVEIISRKFGI